MAPRLPFRTARALRLPLALAVLAAGCGRGGPDDAASSAPRLVLVDSISIAESDSAYIADPNDLAVGPDGTIYVADRFLKKVHAYGRDGRPIRTFGRGGEGPGELMNPSFLAFDADSLLYVVDRLEIERFDTRTGAHVGGFATPRRVGLINVSRGRLVAGYADPASNGSVAALAPSGGGMRVTGPFPELLRNPLLFPMFNSVSIAVRGDTAASAFVVTDYVYLSSLSGPGTDSILVPVRRRNGARPEVLRRFAASPTRKRGEAAVYGSSVPMDLHWLPDGHLALVSTDWRLEDSRFVDSSFVSVVDPRTRRSCVDAPVPGPTDPPVTVGFRGDTLFVLSREVSDASRVSTTVRLYRVDTGACRWVDR